jgi:Predicted hydrolases or acyltransferases (alpha/beta hydrolase superfamily)
MATVKLNGVKFNYKLEGEGSETIVLINGLADDLETWMEQMPDFLAAGYRVLRFDNRGIGKSGRPRGPYTTAQMAADAKALVDHLKIRSFHLVGVSMGGMIAQEYALAHGRDLRSLTLCCTYAAPGSFCSRMFALWRDMAKKMGVPTVMRDVTLWAFTQDFFGEREDVLKQFEAAMATLDQPLHCYLAQLHAIQVHDTTARLHKIAVPTMVLAGAEDILIPNRLSKALQAGIPRAEWATSPGGHAFLWEFPQPYNKKVLDFIGRHRA